MQFIPDATSVITDVPFYEDANAADGWRGHTTRKSLAVLKAEIVVEMEWLGGNVQRFQRGTFLIGEHQRDGFQVDCVCERQDGTMLPGRIDVAALPVRNDARKSKTYEARREKALKMALYMLREGLAGARFIELLSPGYAALLPWMLGDGDVTVGQMWKSALPPGESCGHPGCLNHATHPCEGCGRVAGQYPELTDVIEGEFDE